MKFKYWFWLVVMLLFVGSASAQFLSDEDINGLLNDLVNWTDINATNFNGDGSGLTNVVAGDFTFNISNSTSNTEITSETLINFLCGNGNCTIGQSGSNVTITTLNDGGVGGADTHGNLNVSNSTNPISIDLDTEVFNFLCGNGNCTIGTVGNNVTITTLDTGGSAVSFIQSITNVTNSVAQATGGNVNFIAGNGNVSIGVVDFGDDVNVTISCLDTTIANTEGFNETVADSGLNSTGQVLDVNSSLLQTRVSGVCAANSFTTAISEDGSLTCAVPDTFNGVQLNGELNVTGNITVSRNLTVGGLVSCDTIDTDANGFFTCGTDATAAGGTSIINVSNTTANVSFDQTLGFFIFNMTNTNGTVNIVLDDSNVYVNLDILVPPDTNTDSNASTECSGDSTYLSGEGNCNDLNLTYIAQSNESVLDVNSSQFSNVTNIWNSSGTLLTVSTDIVAVGTITTGVWTGTSIADANVDNDITVSGGTLSSNNVDGTWTTTASLTIGDNGDNIIIDADVWDVTSAGAASFITVNTGNGANELFAMNQDVETTDAVTFITVDTGNGANELFDMDQNVLEASSVTFADVNVTQNVTVDSSLPFSIVDETGQVRMLINSTCTTMFSADGSTVVRACN